jgi:general stress protein 26
MSATRTHDEAWDKLWDLVGRIKTGMMSTVDDGMIRARPMRGYAEPAHRRLWFFTRASSHKTAEIEAEHNIGVAYADPDGEDYVSLSGTARLVHDRTRIREYWNPFVAAWFPEGRDDPDVALIRFDVGQGEWWDSTSSRMIQLYEVAKANLTGREPDLGENEKVRVAS